MSVKRGRHQLFTPAPSGTTAFRSHSYGTANTYDASGVPLPVWPDGRWCIEVAAFIRELVTLRRSTLDRGGTPGTYASELSHLVRFCFANKVDFHRLSDKEFQLFVRGLSAERNSNGSPVRNGTTINRIGRRSLAFLDFAAKRRGIDDFLSPDGPHIHAARRVIHIGIARGRVRRQEYWHHSCFPPMDKVRRRSPISEENINLLHKAAVAHSSSTHLKRRRLTLLHVLEATGGRRFEIANLQVADVKSAKAMELPSLKLLTIKRRAEPEVRYVPVSHAELDYLLEYIEQYRAPLVHKLLKGRDHGFVFVSLTTGKGIRPNTVTQEIHTLRRLSGIRGRAHPHLFRHRFITIRIHRLIVAYKARDAQHFAELFMRLEKLKFDVMQQTGLKSGETLDRYIDWAFVLSPLLDEAPAPAVDYGQLAREGRAALVELEAERAALSAVQYAERVERELMRLVNELSRGEGFKSTQPPGGTLLSKTLDDTNR